MKIMYFFHMLLHLYKKNNDFDQYIIISNNKWLAAEG